MGFSLPLQTKTTLTMITLKELYRIGYGPSSSHTMAPRKAATLFWNAIRRPYVLK